MITKLDKSNKENILELEEKFPNVFSVQSIENDFLNNPYTNYLIYLIDGKIVGFLNYYYLYHIIEIVNFNVLDYFQNRHIGSKLLVTKL